MRLSSEFLCYLVGSRNNNSDPDRIPPLAQLSKELGVSISSLREQMEVARTMGFIEVRPRTGIRRMPYSFFPAVHESLSYSIALDRSQFLKFADMRNKLEAAYWYEAVQRLTPEDHEALQSLMARAWEKLRTHPVQIPHTEHRELHLTIYGRLDNVFVQGILEAYWKAYEAVGLNMYADYKYLEHVWEYHQQIVDAICRGDYQAGYEALVEHKDLLLHRPLRPDQPANDLSPNHNSHGGSL